MSDSTARPHLVDTTVRVRYAETDAQGVVYHANYIVYFEVGRGAYLRAMGLDYNAFEAGGHFVVVVEATARYLAPARYEDELVIRSWIEEIRNSSFTFTYEVRRGDTLVATGRTAHVVVDRSGKPTRIPPALRQAMLAPQEA